MFFVYILKSLKTGKHYVGSTGDLNKRLTAHNAGGTVSTRSGRPWEIIYNERANSKLIAIKREKQIKKYKGGNSFRKLIKSQDSEVDKRTRL